MTIYDPAFEDDHRKSFLKNVLNIKPIEQKQFNKKIPICIPNDFSVYGYSSLNRDILIKGYSNLFYIHHYIQEKI